MFLGRHIIIIITHIQPLLLIQKLRPLRLLSHALGNSTNFYWPTNQVLPTVTLRGCRPDHRPMSLMSASRGNPQPQHYYAITGGSRAVNLPFKPAQKQAPHKLVPRPKVGDPLKSYAVASRVLADGTIMPAPGPSEWNKRATARRAVTADSLVASTQSAWAASSQAEPLPTSKRADGNFSTEYSRSFATPVRLSSPPACSQRAQPSARGRCCSLFFLWPCLRSGQTRPSSPWACRARSGPRTTVASTRLRRWCAATTVRRRPPARSPARTSGARKSSSQTACACAHRLRGHHLRARSAHRSRTLAATLVAIGLGCWWRDTAGWPSRAGTLSQHSTPLSAVRYPFM